MPSDEPALKIENLPSLGGWVVRVTLSDNCKAYLHTDGLWRRSCLGPQGLTGYHPSQHHASHALGRWVGAMPDFKVRLPDEITRMCDGLNARLDRAVRRLRPEEVAS